MIEKRLDLRRRNFAEKAPGMRVRVLVARRLLFVHKSSQASLISTVNILFCNEARVGVSAAIEVGSPM